MNRGLLLAMAALLVSCVSVSLPPNQNQPIERDEAKRQCPSYSPPRRRTLPIEPELNSRSGDYKKDLEDSAEKLAVYAGALRDYIDEEHLDEDAAFRKYQQECLKQ